MDDIELVERLQTGDVEAFDLIYAKYSVKLYHFGLKYLRSEADAEELVQSVFLKVWEFHNRLKKEASFKSFLFTVAYNDICKFLRTKSYNRKFISTFVSENLQSPSPIESEIDYQIFKERIALIIDKLPERQKSIFIKSRDEGKTTKEIAQELKLSPGTVDNYISESLKYIREKLLDENYFKLLLFALYVLSREVFLHH